MALECGVLACRASQAHTKPSTAQLQCSVGLTAATAPKRTPRSGRSLSNIPDPMYPSGQSGGISE
eukprot:3981469-Pleurochrysis_carterae.AAC.3